MLSNAHTLFYSDDPETLDVGTQGNVEGVLFDFDVRAGPATRFLYYHVNADPTARYLCLRVLNMGEQPAVLRWLASVGPPSTAYMHVGHASTVGFLEGLAAQRWTRTNVAAGQNVILRSDATSLGSLVTGILEMALDQGDDIRVSLIVATLPSRAIRVAEQGTKFKPDGKGRSGQFDLLTVVPARLRYTVGGPTVSYRVGDRKPALPNCRTSCTTALEGDYGVISTTIFTLDNRTDIGTKVALYESARAGDATASYLIDGRVVNSQLMTTTDRHKLWVFTVPGPGRVATTLYAMPDSGSNLPVELIVDVDDSTTEPGAQGSLISYGTQYSEV